MEFRGLPDSTADNSATASVKIAGSAGVAKLAYAPALGAGARKSMRVRVPPPALRSAE